MYSEKKYFFIHAVCCKIVWFLVPLPFHPFPLFLLISSVSADISSTAIAQNANCYPKLTVYSK